MWDLRGEIKKARKASGKPGPEEHMAQARDHMNAADMVKEHDHVSASDHMDKAATHAEAASDYYSKHSEKWIQKAQLKKGAFTKKANAAGKTVAEESKSVLKPGSKASSKTKKQAVLAETFAKMRHKKG